MAIEVIRHIVELRRVGRQWRGLCPLHEEQTPSFFVCERGFHCFGCDAKGDIIDFVRMIQGVSFKDAVSHLGILAFGIIAFEYKPKSIDKRKRRAAALLAGWLSVQHMRIGSILRALSRQVSVADQIREPNLVEALIRKWHILCALFDDLQEPAYVAELLEAKTGIESITANAPFEPLQYFPDCTGEYRKFLTGTFA
jgi:CHC2 zinc finger